MLSPGTSLGGRYRLEERVAGGGMGEVWRATDGVLGRIVAVKVLLPALGEQAGFVERFRNEARAMATIKHSGVVDIYDYGNEGATAFLVMEYVEGESLSQVLARDGSLSEAETLSLIAQAADALHAAHTKGIVHRDVKPGNLLVNTDGNVALTDFGIALSATAGRLTTTGAMLATARYISPEQTTGGDVTPVSDVYALGVVAYECLSGGPPFEGGNALEIALRHVNEQPPSLPAAVAPLVRQIVGRAMAKDPKQRYRSAAEFAQVARDAIDQLRSDGTRGQPAGMTGSASPRPSSGIAQPPDAARTVHPPAASRPGSTRLDSTARPVLRPFRRQPILIVGVVALLVAAAGAVWASSRRDSPDHPGPAASSGLPPDLRTFAANWPLDQFIQKDTTETQDEKWGIEPGGPTGVSVFVIRYKTPADRTYARDHLPKTPLPAVEWSKGTGVSPTGQRGPYIEFVVNLGTRNGGTKLSIWWDNSDTQPDGRTALLLVTKPTPTPQDALDRLRGAWRQQEYSGP